MIRTEENISQKSQIFPTQTQRPCWQTVNSDPIYISPKSV